MAEARTADVGGAAPGSATEARTVPVPGRGEVYRIRLLAALTLFTLDLGAASGLLYLACHARSLPGLPWLELPPIPAWVFGSATFMFLAANGLAYQAKWIASGHATFKDLFIASAGAVGVTSMFARTPFGVEIWIFIALALVTSLTRQVGVRCCRRLLPDRVVVLGLDDYSAELARALPLVEEPKFRLIGFIDDRADPERRSGDAALLGRFADAEEIAKRHQADVIVAALPAHGRSRVAPVVEELTKAGTRVVWLEDFYARYFNKIPVHYVDSAWALYGLNRKPSVAYQVLKRLADIALALVGLAVMAALLPIAFIANRLWSRGPTLYSQIRVGHRGRAFRLYKFRTMVTDAEREGARWAHSDDDRITPVGRILRKTHIDELPQCWNVLLGHMSMVGPRPERPEFVTMLEEEIPFFRLRHLVRPGVTGLATVRNGYASSIEDTIRKTEYDLYYIKQRSSWLDLSLVLETALICVLGRNAEGTNEPIPPPGRATGEGATDTARKAGP